jgi:DeoR/GlpR family transcriptional regulator of sugar metabolism
MTIEQLAYTLGVADRTIKRAFKTLQDAGTLHRVGSRKASHWAIIKP